MRAAADTVRESLEMTRAVPFLRTDRMLPYFDRVCSGKSGLYAGRLAMAQLRAMVSHDLRSMTNDKARAGENLQSRRRESSIWSSIRIYLTFCTPAEKRRLVGAIGFSFLIALIQAVSVASVMPFLGSGVGSGADREQSVGGGRLRVGRLRVPCPIRRLRGSRFHHRDLRRESPHGPWECGR